MMFTSYPGILINLKDSYTALLIPYSYYLVGGRCTILRLIIQKSTEPQLSHYLLSLVL